MKKTTVKILSCLIAVMVVTGCVGCGKKPPTVPEINDITLVNFETWEPDFQLCRISSAFGKISINTDKQYVKTGERSARIDPVGDGWMYYPTYSELYEFDYTDFSYINSVRVEMYNAQEEDKTVHVGLVTELMGIDRFNQANEESFLLKPGWNTIDLLVDPNIICMIADITEIQGVYFKYERLDRHSVTEDTPRYYIDSITLKKRDTPHSTQSNIEFGENEIMDFEQFYHKYFLINDFDVDMEIVKAVDYGISAPSGTKVLRLVAPGMASGSWRYYFKLMAPVLKMSALGNLTDEQFENAYFCWDAYNKQFRPNLTLWQCSKWVRVVRITAWEPIRNPGSGRLSASN